MSQISHLTITPIATSYSITLCVSQFHMEDEPDMQHPRRSASGDDKLFDEDDTLVEDVDT
jgi:hypothetical protein